MGTGFCMGVVLATFLQPLVILAQETSPEPPSLPVQSSQPVLPAPLGGFSPTLTASGASSEQANLLTGSLGAYALLSDNTFTASSLALNRYQYSIAPAVGLELFGAHTQWLLNYAGALSVGQQLPGNVQQMQAATASVRHEFTNRLAIEARENYTITNNPFMPIAEAASLPTLGGPGQLSPFAVPSPVTQILNTSTADLTYRLSEHSATGVSGSFSLQHFSDVEGPSGSVGSLIDTTDTTGRAFYLREISPHQTVGAEYQLQDLRFDGGLARTLDQVLFLFDGISFTSNTTLSLYAGPEYTHTHDVAVVSPSFSVSILPFLENHQSLAGGFAYAWRTKRSGVRFSGETGVGDGGGWLGAVRLNTIHLQLQKTLNLRWSATLDLGYTDGRAIGIPASLREDRITTEEGLVGLLYQATAKVTANLQYGRIQQPHLGPFVQALHPNYNQIQVGLNYQFKKAFSK